mgnify:CR=1 FL=1
MKKLVLLMCLISYFSFAGIKSSKDNEIIYTKLQLFYEMQDQDTNKISELLEKIGELDYKASDDGSNLLMVAIGKRNDKIAEFLINKGANTNWKNNNGETVLEEAVKYGNLKTLKLVMNKKPDYGNPLINAIFQNDVLKVKELIDKGFLVEDKEFSEYVTPFMIASFMNNVKIMKMLIEKGASIDKINENGKTALMFAICNNSSEAIQYLISLGVNINTEEYYRTPLMEACELNYLETAEILIKNGASLETPVSLLSVCAKNDSIDVAKKLIEIGVNVNEKDYFNETPLNVAVKFNSLKTAELFIKNGADIENIYEEWDLLRTYECRSLLIAINNNKEMVTLLLDSGAKTDYKYNNKSMLTATDSPKMREFLMSKGIKW